VGCQNRLPVVGKKEGSRTGRDFQIRGEPNGFSNLEPLPRAGSYRERFRWITSTGGSTSMTICQGASLSDASRWTSYGYEIRASASLTIRTKSFCLIFDISHHIYKRNTRKRESGPACRVGVIAGLQWQQCRANLACGRSSGTSHRKYASRATRLA
jgi:hypothetical protein